MNPGASPEPACILLAHGSRDPVWQDGLQAVAAEMRRRAPHRIVTLAFIELCPPSLPEAVRALAESGVRAAVVTPCFLGLGNHGRQDLPRLLAQAHAACPGIALHTQPLVGEQPEMIDLLATLALRQPPVQTGYGAPQACRIGVAEPEFKP